MEKGPAGTKKSSLTPLVARIPKGKRTLKRTRRIYSLSIATVPDEFKGRKYQTRSSRFSSAVAHDQINQTTEGHELRRRSEVLKALALSSLEHRKRWSQAVKRTLCGACGDQPLVELFATSAEFAKLAPWMNGVTVGEPSGQELAFAGSGCADSLCSPFNFSFTGRPRTKKLRHKPGDLQQSASPQQAGPGEDTELRRVKRRRINASLDLNAPPAMADEGGPDDAAGEKDPEAPQEPKKIKSTRKKHSRPKVPKDVIGAPQGLNAGRNAPGAPSKPKKPKVKVPKRTKVKMPKKSKPKGRKPRKKKKKKKGALDSNQVEVSGKIPADSPDSKQEEVSAKVSAGLENHPGAAMGSSDLLQLGPCQAPSSQRILRPRSLKQAARERHLLGGYENALALVPSNSERALTRYSSPNQKQKKTVKPKVQLDGRDLSMWELTMTHGASYKAEDEETRAEWENQRCRLLRLALEFLDAVRPIQGNRKHSKWGGSVLDSVMGAFLTQNVSDHLSSSAFMKVASRFPSKHSRRMREWSEVEDVTVEETFEHETSFEAEAAQEHPTYQVQQPEEEEIEPEELLQSPTLHFKIVCDPKFEEFGNSHVVEGNDISAERTDGFGNNSMGNFSGQEVVMDDLFGEVYKDSSPGMNVRCASSQASLSSPINGVNKTRDLNFSVSAVEVTESKFEGGDLSAEMSSPISVSSLGVVEGDPGSQSSSTGTLDTSDRLGTTSSAIDVGGGPNLDDPMVCTIESSSEPEAGDNILDTPTRKKENQSPSRTGMEDDGGFKNEKFKIKKGKGEVKKGRKLSPTEVGRKYQSKDTTDWESERQKYEGKQASRTTGDGMIDMEDTVDWNVVRLTPVRVLADIIKDRGMNNMLAGRIKALLDRLYENHNKSLSLEWIRNLEEEDAKKFLLSIYGLGLKSVECVRLLCLDHRAFPVDTNVGRICVRMGWVPILPVEELELLSELEMYPVQENIQKYLWPRLCNLSPEFLYELHYQLITFGKVFCTKKDPNCQQCPLRHKCLHYKDSILKSAKQQVPLALEDRNTQRQQLTLEQGTRGGQHHTAECGEPLIEEPIIEEPPSPVRVWNDIEGEEDDMDSRGQVQRHCNSKEVVLVSEHIVSRPVPKLKKIGRLQTTHLVYELRDDHFLARKFGRKVQEDQFPYLVVLWSKDVSNQDQPWVEMDENGEMQVKVTLLVPIRTGMRGSFPLNGTYFQVNEVFADHETSINPVLMSREDLFRQRRRLVYFGSSVTSIFKGFNVEDITFAFERGFVCVRAINRKREAEVLQDWLHAMPHDGAKRATANKFSHEGNNPTLKAPRKKKNIPLHTDLSYKISEKSIERKKENDGWGQYQRVS